MKHLSIAEERTNTMAKIENSVILERLHTQFPTAIQGSQDQHGDLSVLVRAEAIIDVAQFLRDDPQLQFGFLENLCGVDYLGRTPRFEVVYHLLSHLNRQRICLKIGVPERNLLVPSLTGLWSAANYQEREAFDMFGIIFEGHPSLERILMPDDWQGHPQRKDVPLGGEEVAFTFNQDRINAQKPYAKE
jgi:NADH-quinone oxidoreductase subunit C